MSETLYRKYRPKNFSDIIGQEHVVTTLTNAIKTNRVAHAYLFTGSRGTGKTSIARLFAHAINCEKRTNFKTADKTVCKAFRNGSAVDLIEIDAASHTGVDNIRELRDTIALTPTAAPYKVYIIDEVHMLSTGAFNALLKTLEEPPAHAIFILATTEIHKVPETIISRCQRYDFARLSTSHIFTKLQFITRQEKVAAEDEALEMIAVAAEGGMRDAESLLAQVFAFTDKKITTQDVAQVLGITTQAHIFATLESFVEADVHKAIATINAVASEGYNLTTFTTSLIVSLRALLFYTLSPTDDMQSYLSLTTQEKATVQSLAAQTTAHKVIAMITACEEAKTHIARNIVPQLPLEIAAVHICTTADTKHKTPSHKEDEGVLPLTAPPQEQTDTPVKNTNKKHSPDSAHPDTPLQNTSLTHLQEKWPQIVAHIKSENMPLASLLTQAFPSQVDENTLTLVVKYTLHQEKIMERKNQLTITDALGTIVALSLSLKVRVVSENDFYTFSPSEILSRAANMMGGQIVENT